MPTILSRLDAAFRAAISAAFGFEADPVVGVSQNEQFGGVVLAMWYMAMAEHLGETAALWELVDRTGAAVAGKDIAAQNAAVHDLAVLHQRFIDKDPAGVTVFEPYLQNLHLDLATLE